MHLKSEQDSGFVYSGLFNYLLRKLATAELEKIEVAIRAKMIYILSHQYGLFWYSNPSLFANQNRHNASLIKLKEGI
ncbi:MAG: Abi family protein [Pedobacter sp.]|uniref:Abi family protein n=1 Tax=Pedobacter sp. TaxID=1411316 RepID=UPI0035659F28